jgi:chemotaxis methyl-accepting protein methylase
MVQGADKSQLPDAYRAVQFCGTPRPASLRAERFSRPLREAPSPSIFAQPFSPRAPVISPADRLLLDDVFARLQLNGQAYRPGALGRRVPACLRALQARSPAEAQRRLEHDPHALDLALNALLIGVTAFFRDTPVFSHLRHNALPDLLRSTPAPKILSVGCSDGAEAYTLAIILLELHVREIQIRGIDCRRRAIDRAKAGVYPPSALAGVPAPLREKYFEPLPHTYRIKDAVRRLVSWQVADAFIHLPAPPYDLIACRNFAIYLEHAAAARLWRRLHSALRPGGLLLVGKAERPTSGFLRAGHCLFRKSHP